MKVLALDLSSKTGWALLSRVDEGKIELIDSGLIELGKTILTFGSYPWCYVDAATQQAKNIAELVRTVAPDVVVIEETNKGRNRYSQKFLEFLHLSVLTNIRAYAVERYGDTGIFFVRYVSSGIWRKALELSLNPDDRRNNSKLSKAKKFAFHTGQKLDKATLGVKGRVNKKHLAVRYANATYDLNLKMKDNDIADAICLGTAFLVGASICDGK